MEEAADQNELEKVYCNRYTGGCGRPYLRSRVHHGSGRRSSQCPECQAEADERADKPRGRLYDCDSCGDEFRYEMNDDEGSGLTKVCNECRKHGPRCLGGCGVRSKAFGAAGKTTCADCKAKRVTAASAPASSRSLLTTGYAQMMRERMQAADEASAEIAPSPMFAKREESQAVQAVPAHPHPALFKPAARAPRRPSDISVRDPGLPKPRAPIEVTAPTVATMSDAEELFGQGASVLLPIEIELRRNEPEQAEVTTMASGREATCQKSEGGCGKTFKAASSGKLPKRCPECKAAGKAASAPRAAKEPRAPRAAPKYARQPREVPVPQLRLSSPSPVGALFTVRVGQLAIDCHSVEAVDVLVQRYGVAS
jgi:hypothetical protein